MEKVKEKVEEAKVIEMKPKTEAIKEEPVEKPINFIPHPEMKVSIDSGLFQHLLNFFEPYAQFAAALNTERQIAIQKGEFVPVFKKDVIEHPDGRREIKPGFFDQFKPKEQKKSPFVDLTNKPE